MHAPAITAVKIPVRDRRTTGHIRLISANIADPRARAAFQMFHSTSMVPPKQTAAYRNSSRSYAGNLAAGTPASQSGAANGPTGSAPIISAAVPAMMSQGPDSPTTHRAIRAASGRFRRGTSSAESTRRPSFGISPPSRPIARTIILYGGSGRRASGRESA